MNVKCTSKEMGLLYLKEFPESSDKYMYRNRQRNIFAHSVRCIFRHSPLRWSLGPQEAKEFVDGYRPSLSGRKQFISFLDKRGFIE
jgi:hypothetical protein